MNDNDLRNRLSRISTVWELLDQAHFSPTDDATTASGLLVERYRGAVYRYLLSAVRDSNAAQDLTQEFGLRLIRGDFHRVAPERGKFRHYVKTVLFHMVSRYRVQQAKRPRPLPAENYDVPDEDCERVDAGRFQQCWRDQLLARTWDVLQQAQPAYYEVLRFRADHPDLSSAQLAEHLSKPGQKTHTAGGIRQVLLRARVRFAEFLFEEAAHTLAAPSPDEVEQELADLQLLEYCRPFFERQIRP